MTSLDPGDAAILSFVEDVYKHSDMGRDIVAPVLRKLGMRNPRQLLLSDRKTFMDVVDALETVMLFEEEGAGLQFSLDPDDHA